MISEKNYKHNDARKTSSTSMLMTYVIEYSNNNDFNWVYDKAIAKKNNAF